MHETEQQIIARLEKAWRKQQGLKPAKRETWAQKSRRIHATTPAAPF